MLPVISLEKLPQKVGRREIYPPVPPPLYFIRLIRHPQKACYKTRQSSVAANLQVSYIGCIPPLFKREATIKNQAGFLCSRSLLYKISLINPVACNPAFCTFCLFLYITSEVNSTIRPCLFTTDSE